MGARGGKLTESIGQNRRALSTINRNVIGPPPYPRVVHKRGVLAEYDLLNPNLWGFLKIWSFYSFKWITRPFPLFYLKPWSFYTGIMQPLLISLLFQSIDQSLGWWILLSLMSVLRFKWLYHSSFIGYLRLRSCTFGCRMNYFVSLCLFVFLLSWFLLYDQEVCGSNGFETGSASDSGIHHFWKQMKDGIGRRISIIVKWFMCVIVVSLNSVILFP